MKRPKWVDSSSFRLSALYLSLFLLSFVAIGITVYVLTVHALETQLKNTINTEANRLIAEYESGGLAELISEINEIGHAHGLYVYGLVNQNQKLLAGQVSQFDRQPGWQVLDLSATLGANTAVKTVYYLRVITLAEHTWLMVGYAGKSIQEAGKAIIEAFLWGMILVIVLGAAGGAYLTRAFLNKIAGITQSTQAIIAGDLSHRLPVSQNHDELDTLAVLLNQMLDKIGGLIESVQNVSNDIAHDLRTPISRLQFRLEGALNKPLSAEQYQEQISLAIKELDTILNTFSALLRISQIESGSRRSGFKTVNLSDIVVSVVDALYPSADEQGKSICLDVKTNVTLKGDQQLLTQMVFNLFENAIMHTPAGATITLSLRSLGSQIELIVADNGPGIAEPYRQKIFQRFYRLEQSRTTPGNGLGLSIVKAIVALHEGAITLFDNDPGLKIMLVLNALVWPAYVKIGR